MDELNTVVSHDRGKVRVNEIRTPETRNAIDGYTADELYDVFSVFDLDDPVDVAVLTGSNGTFCSGADLG